MQQLRRSLAARAPGLGSRGLSSNAGVSLRHFAAVLPPPAPPPVPAAALLTALSPTLSAATVGVCQAADRRTVCGVEDQGLGRCPQPRHPGAAGLLLTVAYMHPSGCVDVPRHPRCLCRQCARALLHAVCSIHTGMSCLKTFLFLHLRRRWCPACRCARPRSLTRQWPPQRRPSPSGARSLCRSVPASCSSCRQVGG